MNNPDKHIAHWSNTDVQKYLNGELSAREMHDLEQQALDDPFLADALEGLQTQPGEAIGQDLSELQARLDARVTARSAAIPWRAIRVAAAVILLLGLGFTGYYILLDHGQPASIAKAKAPSPAANQPAAPPPATLPPSPPIPPAVAKSAAPLPAVNPAAGKKREKPLEKALPPAAVQVLSDSLASISADIAKDTIHAVANGYLNESRETPALDAAIIRIRGTRPASNSDSPLLTFSGRVLDVNNRPLAGASLTYRFKGTVTGAVTDAKGQFSLYIPQRDSNRQLTVAMAGYEETRYALSADAQTGNTIFLRPNQPELNEVVVSGIGAKRREFLTETLSDNPEKLDSFWLNTAPAMGRIAYLNYLASARKTIPADTAIHGIESISFRVDKKGALTEFRIERSLSPAHDAGVIRLITDGPPWKMVHGRSARALVNVTFP